jgi:hypothetical protein
MTRLRDATVAGAGLLLIALVPQPAAAKIRCDETYQLNKSGPVRTPYCETEYLAVVARERGIAVSGAAIRDSFGTKRRVCQSLRFDNRVSSICIGTENERRGRFKLIFPY